MILFRIYEFTGKTAVKIAGAVHTTVEYMVAASRLTEEGMATLKGLIESLPHICTEN